MAKLHHDPIKCVIEVFNTLFPEDNTLVVLLDSDEEIHHNLFFEGSKRLGWAFFHEYTKQVFIDVRAPYFDVIELIGHELAHAITHEKQEDEHGPLFEATFELINQEYMKKAEWELERDMPNKGKFH